MASVRVPEAGGGLGSGLDEKGREAHGRTSRRRNVVLGFASASCRLVHSFRDSGRATKKETGREKMRGLGSSRAAS